jgi:hypothetical protein
MPFVPLGQTIMEYNRPPYGPFVSFEPKFHLKGLGAAAYECNWLQRMLYSSECAALDSTGGGTSVEDIARLAAIARATGTEITVNRETTTEPAPPPPSGPSRMTWLMVGGLAALTLVILAR